jgi:hypothetical protein
VTEEELADTLNTLERVLVDVGLSSLVGQEQVAAAEGKAEEPTTEDVEAVRQEWAERGVKRLSRPRAGDVRIRPLDTGERLAQLLDLLEIAIGGSYAIETHLRGDLKSALDDESDSAATDFRSDRWNGQIIFTDPAEDASTVAGLEEWSLPEQRSLQQREPAVRQVISLINQLRDSIGVRPSDYLERAAAAIDGDRFVPDFPGGWA